jgi:hypothetical protein
MSQQIGHRAAVLRNRANELERKAASARISERRHLLELAIQCRPAAQELPPAAGNGAPLRC